MSTATATPPQDLQDDLDGDVEGVEATKPRQAQLTFDVGGGKPETAILRLSGVVVLDRELMKSTELHIEITDTLVGDMVGNGYARIDSVEFVDRRDEHDNVSTTERIHKAKVS